MRARSPTSMPPLPSTAGTSPPELRKGRLEEDREVPPGRHEIRVQVVWDGEVKTESIHANFAPGSSRRLAARFTGLGGLGVKRKLKLEWE